MLSPQLEQLYEAQRQRLPEEVTGSYLNTALGPVWVMQAGPVNGPPLLALHGLHTPAPFTLELFWPLTRYFRVIVPDLPGQASRTPGVAPAFSTSAYAVWLDQVMQALGLERCPMVGLSFGGAVILDLAAYRPERISAASLVVPAGFFRPLWRPIKKLLIPLIDFKLHTDQNHFEQLMKPLMADNWPQLEAYYFAVFQAGIPMTLIPPGPFNAEQLSGFSAPVQLILAEEDLYFAPKKLRRAAQAALPNLDEVLAVDDLHIPSPANREQIKQDVVRFMQQKNGM